MRKKQFEDLLKSGEGILDSIRSRNLNIEFYFGSFFSITFFRPIAQGIVEIKALQDRTITGKKPGPSWDQVETKLGLSMDRASKIIEYCLEGKSIIDLMTLFDRKNRTKFKKTFINPLLEENLLSLTMPDKPKSSKQAYITTSKGKQILEPISPGKDQTNNLVPKPGLSWDQVGTKLGLSMDYASKILEYCLDGKSITDLMTFFDRKNRTKFKKTFINPLLEENLLSITMPGKPKSSKQAYITTSKGKQILESISPGKDQTNNLVPQPGPSRD